MAICTDADYIRKVVVVMAAAAAGRPWTAAEQALLENAMRLVDRAAADRWDQIAERVPGRSRREVLARVKELKETLRK